MAVFKVLFVTASAFFRKSSFMHTQLRRYSSALYKSGLEAQKTNIIVFPDMDYKEKFDNIEELEKNVKARRMNFDVRKLKQSWDKVEDLKNKKEKVHLTRGAIAEQIQALRNQEQNDEFVQAEIAKLIQQGKEAKNNYKKLTKKWWELEESDIAKFLDLPNALHSDTPLENYQVLNISGEKPTFEFICQSHTELGRLNDCLVFSKCSPTAYYLKDHLAALELAVMQYFSDAFGHLAFDQFSGPDFCRSVVVEGCGMNPNDPQCVFTLDEAQDYDTSSAGNPFHLVGSASLAPFCAYLTKQVIQSFSALPLQCYSVGRLYEPSSKEINEQGLFHTWQGTAVKFFIATEDNASRLDEQYTFVKDALYEIYKSLGLHFRMINTPAHSLSSCEGLKTVIELYSPYLEKYVEVGDIVMYGDFISRRLRMYYQDPESVNWKYLNVMSGTAVRVPILLACVMESTQDISGGYKTPGILKPYML